MVSQSSVFRQVLEMPPRQTTMGWKVAVVFRHHRQFDGGYFDGKALSLSLAKESVIREGAEEVGRYAESMV